MVAGSTPGSDAYRDAILGTAGLGELLAPRRAVRAASSSDETSSTTGDLPGPLRARASRACWARCGTPPRASTARAASLPIAGSPLGPNATMEGWFRWRAGTTVLRDSTSAGGTGWMPAFETDRQPRIPPRRPGLRHRPADRDRARRPVAPRRGDQERHGRRPLRGRPARPLVADRGGLQAAVGPWHVMRNGTNAVFSAGEADELALYTRALSASEIKSHFDLANDLADDPPPGRAVGEPGRRTAAEPAPVRAEECSARQIRCPPLRRPAGTASPAPRHADRPRRTRSAQRPHRPQARPQLDRPRPARPPESRPRLQAAQRARGELSGPPREANRPVRRRRQRPPDGDRPHPVTPDRRARHRPHAPASPR